MVPGPLSQVLVVIAGIGQYEVMPLKSQLVQVYERGLPAHPVIFVGWSDAGGQLPAAGVNRQLAFAPPGIFLWPSKPLPSTPRSLHLMDWASGTATLGLVGAGAPPAGGGAPAPS